MQKVTVKYQVSIYIGQVEVMCNENDKNEHIIAKARQILRRRGGALPFGYLYFGYQCNRPPQLTPTAPAPAGVFLLPQLG